MGVGQKKGEKNPTAKTSYKKSPPSPPTELSASESSQGRAACWSPAGNSLKKIFRSDGGGGDLCTEGGRAHAWSPTRTTGAADRLARCRLWASLL